MTEFSTHAYYNPHLASGATAVDVILTVTAGVDDLLPADAAPRAAEVLLIDVSGSMGPPSRKLDEARNAAAVAIGCIRDGVEFAVIAGTDHATMVYPSEPTLAVANEASRADALVALQNIVAGGGTSIGRWLLAARHLLGGDRDRLNHVTLLTDGQNGERAKRFRRQLESCEGHYRCDCRGVGTDWKVDELRTIADRLLGTVDIIREPSGLESDFRALMSASMAKRVNDIQLRLWTPDGATVELVAQLEPGIVELTDRRLDESLRVGDYPLGAWGGESRDYHLRLRVPARAVGDEMLAARLSIVQHGKALAQRSLPITWTDDPAMSTKVVEPLEHYVAQEEGLIAVRDALTALDAGDEAHAGERLRMARRIAVRTGDDSRIAEIDRLLDPETGVLRSHIDKGDKMELATRAVRTVRLPGHERSDT
jgi:hypothetical protein